jgi:riboflavin-specific deaminase-like protein
VQRLIPDPGPTTVARQLDSYEPWEHPPAEPRPFVAVNFAATVDGRATIAGVSGPIGSSADTEMLAGLRTRFDAVMIGAGTMRTERYGRPVPSQEKRDLRERIGLPHDPLMVIVSGSLDLPWDAPLFTEGAGQVLIFTASAAEPPETATSVRVVRHEGRVDVAEALRHLRDERGVRALLCEGGPRLHAELQAGALVDDLFLTIAPKLAGGEAPRIIEGELRGIAPLRLAWLLEEEGELFARYSRA